MNKTPFIRNNHAIRSTRLRGGVQTLWSKFVEAEGRRMQIRLTKRNIYEANAEVVFLFQLEIVILNNSYENTPV